MGGYCAGGKTSLEDNMASAAVSKKKLRYVPPLEKGSKPVVHLDSRKFENIRKNYDSLFIGGFVGRRPQFLFVKDAV